MTGSGAKGAGTRTSGFIERCTLSRYQEGLDVSIMPKWEMSRMPLKNSLTLNMRAAVIYHDMR